MNNHKSVTKMAIGQTNLM